MERCAAMFDNVSAEGVQNFVCNALCKRKLNYGFTLVKLLVGFFP